MVMRMVWALCLSLGAVATGIGIELYAAGTAPLVSYSVVVAGIIFVPLSSKVIDRVAATG